MVGRYLKSASRLAIIATAGVVVGGLGAQAADLGGNCCTDLEERVAELEATTARKGNRRVSLTVYGQLSAQLMFWDDGGESNTYVTDNDQNSTRLGVRGSAKITPDITAGYKLEWQQEHASSDEVSQTDDGNNSEEFKIRHAHWFLRSATYGTMTLGQQSTAAIGVSTINLASPDGHAGSGVGYLMRGFFPRAAGGAPGNAGLSAANYGRFLPQYSILGNGSSLVRRNAIKYASPLFLGRSKSTGMRFETSWGEDDYWDVALKYIEEVGAFRFAMGVAFTQLSDVESGGCAEHSNNGNTWVDCQTWTIGASAMHMPTGLYVSGAYAQTTDDVVRTELQDTADGRALVDAGALDDEESWWYIQAGWQAKLNALGNTTFWADYYEGDGGISVVGGNVVSLAANDALNSFGANAAILANTEVSIWGLGVSQAVNAAAMNLYLGYKNISTDATLWDNGELRKSNAIDDLHIFYTGATIKF